MAGYRWHVSIALLWLPVFLLGSFLAAGGLGLILAAMNVYYRDVKYVVPFFVQMAFFVTPVIYPLRYVPAKLRPFIALNPMGGIIEGFRHALLNSPASWGMMGTSLGVSLALFVVGLFVFRRVERDFADVV